MINFVYLGGSFLSIFISFSIYKNYKIHHNVFPAFLEFSKTRFGSAALHTELLVILYMLTQLGILVFFGLLRRFESEKIREKLWFAITDTCIAFAVFSEDILSSFFVSLSYLLFLKYFHFSHEIRIGSIERDPIINRITVFRMLGFFLIFFYLDFSYVISTFNGYQAMNSLQYLLINEHLILGVSLIYNCAKFVIHYIDYYKNFTLTDKSLFLSYLYIIKNFCETVLYATFLFSTIINNGVIPLLFIRPFLSASVNFVQSVKTQINSNRVYKYIDSSCPNVTERELQTTHDNTCVVCREEMITAKKLPCGHMFHHHCLKSWFQRQQTCPTCRLDVLAMVKSNSSSAIPSSPNIQQSSSSSESSGNNGNRNKNPISPYDSNTDCVCPSCSLLKSFPYSISGLPKDPQSFLNIPSKETVEKIGNLEARDLLIKNIKLNLESASVQLELLENVFAYNNADSNSNNIKLE